MKPATVVRRVVLLVIGVLMTLAVAVGGTDIQLAASKTAPADNGQREFAIRAVDTAGNLSAATPYPFTYANDPPHLPFKITGSVRGLAIGVWKPISVTITNPNRVTIYVNALRVAAAADSTPPGCLTLNNIELDQSSISISHSVAVPPGGGTVVLPAQGAKAPRIRLKNLPFVNQDVCKNKSFGLTYSGTATK